MTIGLNLMYIKKLFLLLLMPIVICSCVSATRKVSSPYGLFIYASLTGDMIHSGKRSNTPTIQNTACQLHLFIDPDGGALEIKSRLSKTKNYNGPNDLRSLGHTYKMKFEPENAGIIKKEKRVPCNSDSQWLVKNVGKDSSYRLYFSWLGYRNGYKELDADRLADGFAKELLIGKAKEKIVIMSVFEDVEVGSSAK